jgi:competence protein CoiA
MRYAIIEGHNMEPSSGLKGICPGCGNAVMAKCGQVKVHHWAHLKLIDCDPWWEPMTQWHLDWQNEFPKDWREIIFKDEDSGEFHRADVHTPKGVTIEFQHSALSLDELDSRNSFYKKVLWVVDAKRFKGEFIFTKPIPNPESRLLLDYNFSVDNDGLAKFAHFFLKKELKDYGPAPAVRIYSLFDQELQEVANEFSQDTQKYFLFNWKYKHRAWLNSEAPVFLDFGDNFLYWIRRRKQVGVPLIYIRVVTKKEFIDRYANV